MVVGDNSSAAFDGTYWFNAVPNKGELFYPAPSTQWGSPVRNPLVGRLVKAYGKQPPNYLYPLSGYSAVQTLVIAATRAVFAINFSGQSLNDAAFADELLSRIEASGLPPQSLCFELTESATIANLARAEVLMRRLRKLGCGIALDDFGTGLSSLAYLRQLPVSMLKIDGSFVRDILLDSRSESLVQAVAQLARSMQMVTVAEYVETDAIRERVAALGVDYGQGFSIGRPVPLVGVLADLPAALGAVPRPSHPPAVEPAPGLH